MAGQHSMSPGQAAAFTVAVSVPGFFGFFCPSLLDTGKHDTQLVRQQQVKATAASFALGIAGSAVTRTPWPFLLAVGITGLIMWQYEQQNRKPAAG